MKQARKYLSAKGLLAVIRDQFKKIKPPRALAPRTAVPMQLTDCLMSGLAVFGMKFPSLLQFEEQASKGGIIKRNLRTLYHIEKVPSDTYMRERLDELDPREVRKVYKTLFSCVQRGKTLENFTYWDNHYLMPMDMTGFFSSPSIHCENCCIKKHNKAKLKLFDEMPDDINHLRKDTYILFGNLCEPWQLFYVNPHKELISINMEFLPDLRNYLRGKTHNQFFSSHIATIKEMISSYHDNQHDDQVTYYHNMMCAAIVHPDMKIVLPFAPEPVMKSDGLAKNDCERHAAKRLISDIRREHPHLKLIAVQDALASNYPNLQQLKEANMRFIVGVKPGDHKALFDFIKKAVCEEYQHMTDDGKTHFYRYVNQAPLNDSYPDFKVNFIEYWETDKKGHVQHFSWVSDITLTNENIYHIMRGGRANWKIENHAFNTLKNQGYHFSHNFGHGYQHLCTIFGMLMMLAFFIDQAQELCCALFQKARAKFITRTGLWNKMKSLFIGYVIESWDDLFNSLAYGHVEMTLQPNTS